MYWVIFMHLVETIICKQSTIDVYKAYSNSIYHLWQKWDL